MLPLDSEDFVLDSAKASKGKELFATMGCASCHALGNKALSTGSSKELVRLKDLQAGCLAETPAKGVPQFDISAAQRSSLRKALGDIAQLEKPLAVGQVIASTMARMGCYACHTREGKGGPTDSRLAYFRTIGDLDMGDEGRIPPHLTGVEAKLRTDWLRQVLLNKAAVRPYMATRMPQFGERNLTPLLSALTASSTAGSFNSNPGKEPDISQRDAKLGRRLVGVGGLSCVSCHTFAGHASLGIPAIDLTLMTQRLRFDWFHRYLIDPPALRPGTRMPAFWPGGEAVNKDILNGNTESQIKAIWAYLSEGAKADLPNGLVQGKKEIIAETEPVIYRNFIQGAGPRAIAVGYPEKVNLAFDANATRLAIIWQGAFIDASRHMSGRGEGFEPPLGNNIVKFPEGSAFAILEEKSAQWPAKAGKEAGYRMRGYRLDEKRKPTFLYEFNGIRIEDAIEPVSGEIDASFKRTLHFESPKPVKNLWFRAAAGNLAEKGNAYVLDNKVTFKFTGVTPMVREKELLVPIQFDGSTATLVEEIIW